MTLNDDQMAASECCHGSHWLPWFRSWIDDTAQAYQPPLSSFNSKFFAQSIKMISKFIPTAQNSIPPYFLLHPSGLFSHLKLSLYRWIVLLALIAITFDVTIWMVSSLLDRCTSTQIFFLLRYVLGHWSFTYFSLAIRRSIPYSRSLMLFCTLICMLN